jgi:hypothetical protein
MSENAGRRTVAPRRVAVLVVVAVLWTLVPGAPAGAAAERERVGQAALAMIDYDWQALGWEIAFLPERDGFLGLALGPQRRIEIFVRPSQSVDDVAHVVAHEIGHAVDLTYNDDRRRRVWLKRRGLEPRREWFGCDGCTDYATPAGDFAETFEHAMLGPSGWQSEVAPLPGDSELARLRVFFLPPGVWPPRAI